MSAPACRVCGSDHLESFENRLPGVTSDAKPYPRGSGSLCICWGCGLVQKPDRPEWRTRAQRVYDQYDIYHQSDGTEQQLFTSSRAESRSERILGNLKGRLELPPDGRLLDVGCGNGSLLRVASRLLPRWQLAGYDLDDRHEDDVPGDFSSGDISDICDRFDIITLSHVLEHIPEPVPFLKTLSGLLTPGGVIVAQVPDLDANPFDLMVVDHASHFTLETLDGTLARAGLATTILDSGWVPKELTAVVRPEPSVTSFVHYETEDGQRVEGALTWLRHVADEAQELATTRYRFAVFGTSIAGVWLYGALHVAGVTITSFVDEDTSRIGRMLFGCPVVHPADVEPGTTIFVPAPPALARPLVDRLSSQYMSREWVAA